MITADTVCCYRSCLIVLFHLCCSSLLDFLLYLYIKFSSPQYNWKQVHTYWCHINAAGWNRHKSSISAIHRWLFLIIPLLINYLSDNWVWLQFGTCGLLKTSHYLHVRVIICLLFSFDDSSQNFQKLWNRVHIDANHWDIASQIDVIWNLYIFKHCHFTSWDFHTMFCPFQFIWN